MSARLALPHVLLVGLLAWAGCAAQPSARDLQVLEEAAKAASLQAQRTVLDLRAEIQRLEQDLGAARVGQARLEGELREAQRRVTEAERTVSTQREELARVREERDRLAQAEREMRGQLVDLGRLRQKVAEAEREQARLQALEAAVDKLSKTMPVPAGSGLGSARERPFSGEETVVAPPFPPVNRDPKEASAPPTGSASAAPSAESLASIPPSSPARPSSTPPTSAVLSLLPPDRKILVGQEVTLDVLVSNLEDLAESTLTVKYDPTVLEFRRATEGEFLKRDGAVTAETTTDAAAGAVMVKLKRASGAKGVSGAGVLVTLAFTGKGSGASPVTIQSPQLLSAARAPLQATVGQGNVRVQGTSGR